MKNLESKRLRQLRLNIAYKQSDKNLSEQIESILGTTDYTLHVRHHSHQLTNHMVNARRYNRKRTNGITVVVLQSPVLAAPVFGYSVCSVEDTFSRLIGRVLAKENLIQTFVAGSAQVLPEHQDTSRQHQLHRYVNYIVEKVAPRIKPVVADTGVNPLLFVDENKLSLDVKQLISRTFATNTKEIECNFMYVRRYSNNFFGNQFASLEYIQDNAETYPEDSVVLESTGGYTVGVFKFKYEGVDHLVYSAVKCLPEDHFNKSIGRKLVLKNIQRSNIFKTEDQIDKKDHVAKLTGIFRGEHLPEKAVMLEQLTIHALSTLFQQTVNTYIGSNNLI